jgi:hypothetical protein
MKILSILFFACAIFLSEGVCMENQVEKIRPRVGVGVFVFKAFSSSLVFSFIAIWSLSSRLKAEGKYSITRGSAFNLARDSKSSGFQGRKVNRCVMGEEELKRGSCGAILGEVVLGTRIKSHPIRIFSLAPRFLVCHR